MSRMLIRSGIILVITMGLTAGIQLALRAQPPTTSGGSGAALLNLQDTVALHGYDPVAYFTRHRAVPGRKAILERVGGATYYFNSRANRYTFLSDATRFQPQFGGFCVTSLAQGRLEDVNPDKFLIYQGKLYLFKDDDALGAFLSHPGQTIHEANQTYFALATRKRTGY